MNLIHLAALCCAVAAVSSFGQITNLGTIRLKSSLVWSNQASEGVTSYKIYLTPTNAATGGSGAKVYTVSTNQWPGTATTNISGPYHIFLTAVRDGIESEPSATFLVTFQAGRPLPPSNVQIFQVVQALATNNLPFALNQVPPPPPVPGEQNRNVQQQLQNQMDRIRSLENDARRVMEDLDMRNQALMDAIENAHYLRELLEGSNLDSQDQ